MIQNPSLFAEFERRLIASEPVDFERNLRLADDLYRHCARTWQVSGTGPVGRRGNQYPVGEGLPKCFESNLSVQKVVAGRPRDLEDARTVILKNPRFDRVYVEKWLQEFDQELDGQFLGVFQGLMADLS